MVRPGGPCRPTAHWKQGEEVDKLAAQEPQNRSINRPVSRPTNKWVSNQTEKEWRRDAGVGEKIKTDCSAVEKFVERLQRTAADVGFLLLHGPRVSNFRPPRCLPTDGTTTLRWEKDNQGRAQFEAVTAMYGESGRLCHCRHLLCDRPSIRRNLPRSGSFQSRALPVPLRGQKKRVRPLLGLGRDAAIMLQSLAGLGDPPRTHR